MGVRTSRVAAGAAIAAGSAGALLAARHVAPTIETLLAPLGATVPLSPPKPNAYIDDAGRSLVSVAMDADPVQGTMRAIELLGGLGRLKLAGRRVLIKPNANSGLPAPASTSPEVLETVIRLVWDAGARDVVVGEMSGPPWHDTTAEMQRNGLLDAADRVGARFVDFRYDRWVRVPLGERARFFGAASIPRTVYEAERLIGLPSLKTHGLARYSLAIKLWFGAIHPRQRLRTHLTRDLGRALAELNIPFWPDLMLLDGSRAMIAGGPKEGQTTRADLFLASGDRIALDVCGVALLASHNQWSPVTEVAVWQQPQIRGAIDYGLGADTPDHIALVADPARRDDPRFGLALHHIEERAGIATVRAPT